MSASAIHLSLGGDALDRPHLGGLAHPDAPRLRGVQPRRPGFALQARPYALAYSGYFFNKRYLRANSIPQPPPIAIDWPRQRARLRTQVIRQNCTNTEYHRLLQEGRKKLQDFVDGVFGPSSSSLGNGQLVLPCTWRRHWWTPSEGFPYSELVQGVYRTENLLSCFLALPLHHQLSLFEDQDYCDKAAFFVKLHKEGSWRYILIDNYFPFTQGDIGMLSRGFALSLLEKVWAKHLGSYSALDQVEHSRLGDILTDLTGAPSEEFKCSHPKLLFILKIMLKRGYILLASNQGNPEKRSRMERLGIPVDYSYPVTGIIGDELILRNDWGALRKSDFYGATELRLPAADFRSYFDSVVVNKVLPDGCHHSVSLRQKKGFYSLLRLTTDHDTLAFLTVFQIHTLHQKEEYSACRLVLF